jgi:putative SOS response-associated peptidase YedK
MCGRFTLANVDQEWLSAEFGVPVEQLEEISELVIPRFNVAPMQEHWVVQAEREERAVLRATWGLVNWWDKQRREGAKHINARAEGLERRRPFREAFAERRCIVPADGFFEWTGEKQARRPFWYHRPDGGALRLAGLYSIARLKGEASPVATFTIITTDSNALVGRIHDRMPVVLPDDEAADQWLYPRQEAPALRALLRPAADGYLVARPVSPRVNSVQNDDPECLAESEAETQPSLL